jgi:acyl dehydratase
VRAETVLKGSPRMGAAFARAGLSMVPGSSVLPFVGGGGGAVPERALALTRVRVDRRRLADYDRVCGFDLSDTLPATYPHMLAFPLQLALMTSPRFPVGAIGLVHVSNRIVAHRPIDAGERLALRVWATPLRAHPRGRAFDLRSEAWIDDLLVWEETSTNLVRGRRDDAIAFPDAPPDSSPLAVSATWRLPGDLGRRYGAVSGDLNPIHIHPLTAKLFGFPTAIAHGMWTAARCLAQLGPELPGGPFTVDVAFKRPILLPAKVAFAEAPISEGDGIAFGVRDARRGTVHLDGLLRPDWPPDCHR